jgi:capsid protein
MPAWWSNLVPTKWFGAGSAYDGVDAKGKRRQPAVTHLAEDQLLNSWSRAMLGENARDLARNFSIVQWMVGQHLNYVARFTFQGATRDDAFNRALEERVRWHSAKGRCDATGQESFRSFLRNVERHRVQDGDYLTVLLHNQRFPEGRLQGIEFDRLRSPDNQDDLVADAYPLWIQGVELDDVGQHLRYAVHRRTLGGFQLDTIVAAAHAIFLAYKHRTDQTRGTGLLASALNYLRDAHENLDAALLKSKVQSLFALVFETQIDLTGEGDNTASNAKKKPYQVDFGNGPMVLRLNPGDKAHFASTDATHREFREFMTLVLLLTLKALDLPYSMLDESFTNYSGHRGAWLHYEQACFDKRETLREFCDRVTWFWIALDLQSGALQLPRGLKAEDIAWTWIPPGRPWWKPQEEIYGELTAIAAGITTFDQVVHRFGTGDIRSNIDANAAVLDYAKTKGFPLQIAPPGATGKGASEQSADEKQG